MLDSSEMDLIRLAQQGSQSAIGQLYDRHQEQLFRFVWSRVGDRQQAEDITGEIFTRMVANLPGYQMTGVPFRAWLYQIGRNLITDAYRRQNGRFPQPLEDVQLTGDNQEHLDMIVDQQLTLEKIQTALDQIDPQQSEAVRLRFLVGLSLSEAAETMDCSIPALKSLQHRGLKALRATLKQVKR